ncbi:NUDIX hydrolase domain-like protein [Blastocladiella britannica]|nr:NUDIX hydrolase domain-like protein [Blastocladiella britannica]
MTTLPAMLAEQPTKPVKKFTLVLVHDAGKNRVLLGYKKRGFGMGLWNGFGGKLEPGESFTEAAARELHEESGLQVPLDALHRIATLLFDFAPGPESPDPIFHVALFSVAWSAVVDPNAMVESDEMAPQWWPADAVPFGRMWPDDKLWWPYFMRACSLTSTESDQFLAQVWFAADQKTVLRWSVDAGSAATELD